MPKFSMTETPRENVCGLGDADIVTDIHEPAPFALGEAGPGTLGHPVSRRAW